MRSAVNISPLALARDGRSLRFAHSLHRNNWKVSVVEGVSSEYESGSLPFPVVSLSRARIHDAITEGNMKTGLRARFPLLWQWAGLISFALQVFVIYPVRALTRIPAADLYILHEYRWFPAIYTLSRLRGGKILYDAHDFYPLVHRRSDLTPFWRYRFRPFLFWLERACVRHAAAMTTVNQGIADLYRRLFGIEAIALRNLHDRSNDRKPDVTLRRSLGLGEGVFLIVVIGNQKASQKFEGLLDALRGSPSDVHVAFIGRGYLDIPPRARERGVEARTHVVGSIDNDQMVPFIADADATMILYSARSGNDVHFLPNGFFHGVAAGLPVMFPNLRWISKIANEYEIGIQIDPEVCSSISDGISRLRELRSSSDFQQSLQRAKAEITWDKESELLISLADHLSK